MRHRRAWVGRTIPPGRTDQLSRFSTRLCALVPFFFFSPLSLSLYYGALLLHPVYTGILYVGDLIKHGIPND